MKKNLFRKVCLLPILCGLSQVSLAAEYQRSQWTDISQDTKFFDKNCDYKVWVLEKGEWNETWYLEAFDKENAFYTINRDSSSWTKEDAFYALNYRDKTKFLIGDNYIDVNTFSLCLKHGK